MLVHIKQPPTRSASRRRRSKLHLVVPVGASYDVPRFTAGPHDTESEAAGCEGGQPGHRHRPGQGLPAAATGGGVLQDLRALAPGESGGTGCPGMMLTPSNVCH